jgi:predicted polyphosphate/ATP-dependent NAD kinase
MTQTPIAVGIIANPSSGRDIRRLLARASVYPTPEKINVVLRLLSALGPLGVEEAWMLPDRVGISASVQKTANYERKKRANSMPLVREIEMESEDSVLDTWQAVRRMHEMGVKAIAVLGGDGTHRAVARYCGDIPLATLSTGTNNAFPSMREATSTGLAMGLYATGRIPAEVALRRNKILHVQHGNRHEIALVDVAVTKQRFLGARAVWQPADLSRLFVTYGEADAIGLSSIAGMSLPSLRHEPFGTEVRFGGDRRLLAPIAPGLLDWMPVESAHRLEPDTPIVLSEEAGTIALDGEREIEFHAPNEVSVWLDLNGPYTIAVAPSLAYAAQNGLLWEQAAG